MAKSKRGWAPRELRLVSEFVATYYPAAKVLTRVKLGRVHPRLLTPDMDQGARRAMMTFNRWADAVVITDRSLILIEATIPSRPEKVGQLLLYAKLIPTTEELSPYLHLPLELMLVSAVEDPIMTNIAREQGIKVVYFKPAWVDAYLWERPPRYSSPRLSPELEGKEKG